MSSSGAPPSPHDGLDRGLFAALFGAMLGLYGASRVLARLFEEPVGAVELVLGGGALALSPFLFGYGVASMRRARAARRAYFSGLPAEDRIEGDALSAVAEAFGGALLGASEETLASVLRGGVTSRVAPEHHERVAFVREGVPLLAYVCEVRGQWMQDDVGPGIYETSYFRVSAQAPSRGELHVFPRSAASALADTLSSSPTKTGDRAFDERFAIRGDSSALPAGTLDAASRALLLRFPTMILRSHRGRVEALWPRDPSSPELLTRFSAAASLVVGLTRALEGASASA